MNTFRQNHLEFKILSLMLLLFIIILIHNYNSKCFSIDKLLLLKYKNIDGKRWFRGIFVYTLLHLDGVYTAEVKNIKY